MAPNIESTFKAQVQELLAILNLKNPCAITIAVISTERFFRNSFDRCLEYLAWIFLWLLKDKRMEELSLGIAQIQLKHWHRLDIIKSFHPTIANISKVASIKENYVVAQRILWEGGIDKHSNVTQIARCYNGQPRSYYCQVLGSFLNSAHIMIEESKHFHNVRVN